MTSTITLKKNDWSKETIAECTHYGKLYLIVRKNHQGVGVIRTRRKGTEYRLVGSIKWIKFPADSLALIEVKDLLFKDNSEGYYSIIKLEKVNATTDNMD